MRNYIEELKVRGYSYEVLAKETGVSVSKLRSIKTGRTSLHSTSPLYERIRNANRRIGYREARRAGLAPDKATGARRTLFAPDLETHFTKKTRRVQFKETTTRFQVRILGDFYNLKLKKSAISEGFSWAYPRLNKKRMTGEAIAEAQSRLGGTDWILQRLIELEVMEYKLVAQRIKT